MSHVFKDHLFSGGGGGGVQLMHSATQIFKRSIYILIMAIFFSGSS